MNNKNVKETKNKSGLKNILIRLVIIPLFIMGIVTMIFAYIMGYKTVSSEVKQGLINIANAALYSYQDVYAQDIYFLDNGDGTYKLDDDKTAVVPDTAYIDYLKEKSNTDITLFYYDIRMITTFTYSDGERLTGTVVSKKIVDDVFGSKTPVFYDNVVVESKSYFACYIPVFDKDDKCIGMVFAGKPAGVVKNEVFMSALPMLLISLVMMILGGLLGANEAKKLADVISKEKNFLGQIADGNLRANLDADILKRPDELGEMGKFTVHVQRFIRDMIERDTLTKLYTRRIGQTRLLNTRMGFVEDGVPFQIVMGDIDHFKRFNDTYGHDCGDLVLQSVAGIFNRMMIGKGYAVRWGGEEFIIVYENMTFEEAYEHLCLIREEVINHIVEYNGEHLNITMTFGIVPGSEDELDDIIKIADELLYIGKEGGRDRIVKLDDYESLEQVSEALAESKVNHDKASSGSDREMAKSNNGSGSDEEDRLDALMKGLI